MHGKYGLSPSEITVLEHVSNGLSTNEIAWRVGISMRSVEHHSNLICEKMGVRNKAQMAAVVSRHRLSEVVRQINGGEG